MPNTYYTCKNATSVPLEHPYQAHQNIASSELHTLDTWGHLMWLGTSLKETDEFLIKFIKSHQNNE
ncbi:hypothetical protein MTP04_03620 [Lysinibacillus sp. PLM2]|nr:hypothetical protein MTP04_03620 [Lysinibacillus sp. PLM2]